MQIKICCNCGQELCLASETIGNVVYVGNKGKFYYDSDIDIALDKEVVKDEYDVSAELKELRVTCHNCREYLCLSF